MFPKMTMIKVSRCRTYLSGPTESWRYFPWLRAWVRLVSWGSDKGDFRWVTLEAEHPEFIASTLTTQTLTLGINPPKGSNWSRDEGCPG